jgi:hypothetical protein
MICGSADRTSQPNTTYSTALSFFGASYQNRRRAIIVTAPAQTTASRLDASAPLIVIMAKGVKVPAINTLIIE